MFAVAAGNENANVASFSPASEPSACTVGGTTINDQVMSTSNYGALCMFRFDFQGWIYSQWNDLLM